MKICSKHPEFEGLRLRTGDPKRKYGMCVACNRENNARHYEANKELIRAKHRAYATDNYGKNRARMLAWAKANRERHNANARSWRKANPEKSRSFSAAWKMRNAERALASVKAWQKANPEKVRAADRRRSVRQLGRSTPSAAKSSLRNVTPSWANHFFMKEAYRLAQLRTKLLGFKWEVDHIVPLRSKIVSGLHVENNLRVIPSIENNKKKNKHWPDMPSRSSLTHTALSA